MGIDYVVHYDCEPKRALTLEGLMARLKGRERADAIIELYRAQGDQRPPREMGFELGRNTAEGGEEQQVVIVQDLLDAAEELMPWEKYCVGCPANHMGRPFGCIGAINYPLSLAGERWLLDQLPGNDYPLVYLLLQKAIHEQGAPAVTVRGRALNNLVFRNNATLSADEIGQIPQGTEFVIEARNRNGAWYLITYEGQPGWVNAAFVRLIEGRVAHLPIQ